MTKLPKTWRYCGRKHHLVGTLDDRGKEVVVSRWWARTRQRWEYESTPLWLVLLWIEQKETE